MCSFCICSLFILWVLSTHGGPGSVLHIVTAKRLRQSPGPLGSHTTVERYHMGTKLPVYIICLAKLYESLHSSNIMFSKSAVKNP